MLGLPWGLKHTHLQRLTCRTLTARKLLKSVQSRAVAPFMQTIPGNTNRSFSVFSFPADGFPSNTYRGVGTIDEAIARSKSGSQCSCDNAGAQGPQLSSDPQDSSEAQTPTVALPEIPRIRTKKRTLHIDHEDLEARVRPLLARHWHVARVGDVVESSNDDLMVFSLNKLFSFKNFRGAVEFFDALADVQDEERHHARVTVDYANVYVSVHTHVAYQPGSTSDADVNANLIKISGLTVRDIRFAVEVERLHEKFLGDGRAVTSVPADSASLQEWSMEQLQRRYPVPYGQDTGKSNDNA